MLRYGTLMQQNSDGSFDLVIYIDQAEDFKLEFAKELSVFKKGWLNNKKLRFIKIVLAGTLIFSIPFSQIAAKGPRYAMSYIYFGSNASQLEYISLAQDTLAVISPSYFDLNADGSLKQNYISESFVNAVHDKGIRVVPFLSNHWDRASGVNALNRLDQLTDEIALAVERYQLDGVNVDIENVTHTERDKYTELLRLLREKIPNGKEVSVAVAANPNGWNTGWHGSYDYRRLAEYADHLFIMSYDEHYQGGAAGPVASLNFVERSVQYALNNQVPASKIVLGIPFFGRLWAADGSVKGLGVSINRVEDIIAKYGGKVTYSETARIPKAEFTLTASDSLTVTGTNLGPGDYEIWYENSNSIKEKLALVDKYDLKGAGNWSSGQETRDVWDYYDLWLNSKYFEDIFHHFAKDDIIQAVKEGHMIGTSNTHFSPDDSLTRAQAATIASRVLKLSPSSNTAFSDTKGHWAEREIAAAAEAGFFMGYPDGSFQPERVLSREEMASLLFRMIQTDVQGAGPVFSDVLEERWSYQEITALAQAGILNGYEDDTFRPERALTRGEMAALLARLPEQ